MRGHMSLVEALKEAGYAPTQEFHVCRSLHPSEMQHHHSQRRTRCSRASSAFPNNAPLEPPHDARGPPRVFIGLNLIVPLSRRRWRANPASVDVRGVKKKGGSFKHPPSTSESGRKFRPLKTDVFSRAEYGASFYRQKNTRSPTRFTFSWTPRALAAAPRRCRTAAGVSPLPGVRRPVSPAGTFLM